MTQEQKTKMVQGLKTRKVKSPSVQLDYVINIIEVKPWPPSQSLRSLRSALIQWEHVDKNSGATKAVAPLLVSDSGVGDGKIEFNESFRLHVTLLKEMSIKAGEGDTFLKNCIEFNMYEPRRDRTVKGQLLATAVVDFAEYGIVKDGVMISVPMNCKRTFSNTNQPMLFLKVQALQKNNRVRSLSRDSLVREGSIDRSCSESVSALMNEEYAEEAETTSNTDDDVSSQSSMAAASSSTLGSNGSSTPQKEKGSEAKFGSSGKGTSQEVLVQDKRFAESMAEADACTTLLDRSGPSFTLVPQKAESCTVQLLLSSIANDGTNTELNANSINGASGNLHEKVPQKASTSATDITGNAQESMSQGLPIKLCKMNQKSGSTEAMDSQVYDVDDEQPFMSLSNTDESQSGQENQTIAYLEPNILNADRIKKVKSVRSPLDSGYSNGSWRTSKLGEKIKDDFHAQNGGRSLTSNERKDFSKLQHLEDKVRSLEGELREAAGIEIGLYSIVAEHGSSITKVHAPARRLSRLYLHACKEKSQSRRASSARSVVSGLILVAKACGNDVPRLTFWLSNSVVLRAIIHKTFEEEHAARSAGQLSKKNVLKGNNEINSPLKWKKDASLKETRNSLRGISNEWENPCTFTSALEKVESWIFERIVESVWWQTLTPYMQSAAAKAIIRVVDSESSKACQKTSSSGDQEQANFSLELWKTAFMDACERLCPVRAGGHDCGCLPVLSRLVMEQCMARLDVAMFNAILRESADEVPTDPVSDPISDPRVLPISSGKASFGAGAQLKNVIGNWSRWLTDLFGIDDDESFQDENDDDKRKDYDASFKSFRLLNALSDLMMLPKDMLLSNTIRKEVCPTFGTPLIKRILDNFVPDEFCPDPIPEVVLEALDSEDSFEGGEDSVISLPCAAASVVYHPPSASSIRCMLGDGVSRTLLTRSGSILKKSNTSDDELDELNSPLTAIIDTFSSTAASMKPSWRSKDIGSHSTIRYQLLKEVWMNNE